MREHLEIAARRCKRLFIRVGSIPQRLLREDCPWRRQVPTIGGCPRTALMTPAIHAGSASRQR
jgi:hypothetical protein